ncbi:DUF169 domain-containing protein [Desulfoluna sp.]|uniref:DUF169 domain-containing protein n=1 Tax=Desulfoluna sp. TaxID=2045199 RepID=UPI00261B8922|nr:DUF169 domain-containing protein [Desulfoluna sp.]
MNYTEAHNSFIWNFRLDFDPVGIRYIFDEEEIATLPVTHRSKAKISYCMHLAAARSARHSLFMAPDRLLCKNAQPVFGFRELTREVDGKNHEKYLLDPELSWDAPQQKARLEVGACKGIFMAPLDTFDDAGIDPHVVFIMAVPFQAYHIMNDYMGATGKPNLTLFTTPNSAVCSGSVYAYNNNTLNMTTMCAGAKSSGKSEMNYMNVFVPGTQILDTAAQLQKRIDETGGPSLLGKGGQPWPGLDVCSGCPMVRFEKVEK